MTDKLISIIVPMYFEELVVHECYKRLKEIVDKNNMKYEIIFINDGSTDKTMDILREISLTDENVKVIDFSRNFGHQIAVSAGIDYAKGDAIVIIDADLQDPPELIVDMIKQWKNGYQVVYGKRVKRKGETIFKKATAKLFYKILDELSDVKIPRDVGDFRLIDKKVVEVLKNMPEKNRFLRGMIAWTGYKQTYVEYERDARFAGKTKYSLKKMIKLAADGIIGFSSKPLKMIISLGFLTTCISFILLVYAIIMKITGHANAGWASIMVAITFFSGIQLMSLGIIGEYVSRMFEQSKNRPLYIVSNEINIEK